MEFIFLILVIWGVIAIASNMSPKKAAADPASFGKRLQALANSGKKEKLRELLVELPDWPIRGLLVSAAENLGELRRGTALAVPAGVPTQTTQHILQLVEQNEQAVWSTAVRVASLAQQSGVSRFAKLPGEAIQWLNRDTHVLAGINQAAYDACQSLTVAIAKGRGMPDEQNTMSVELQALAAAVRKLSGPSEEE